MAHSSNNTISAPTRRLSTYMAKAPDRRLPAKVVEKAKHQIIDTLAAMVSGSRLWPGEQALAYVKTLGGPREAGVVGSRLITSTANAALSNGIAAHSDETDDSHPSSGIHPGAPIISAALATAERIHASGQDFLRAVVLGYDVGCRSTKVLGVDALKAVYRSTHSYGGTFGAGAAAGTLLRLDARQSRYLLSYSAQLASGCGAYMHDTGHIQKAFVYGGKPAHAGVTAASLVAAGFTGPDDVFTGERNFLDAYSPKPDREAFANELGKRYEILETSNKKWCVGSPIQAVLDSLSGLMADRPIAAKDVAGVDVHLCPRRAQTADNRPFPDVNTQHLVALLLTDGKLTFASCHDRARMTEGRVLALKNRVRLVPDDALTSDLYTHQAIVKITFKDARKIERYTQAVRGTRHNPMVREEIVAKARDLMDGILGAQRAQRLVDAVYSIEELSDMTLLRPLLTAPTRKRA
jgi:2-methylcitrate dehydratase PrpD